jgi:hypothetical protein
MHKLHPHNYVTDPLRPRATGSDYFAYLFLIAVSFDKMQMNVYNAISHEEVKGEGRLSDGPPLATRARGFIHRK